MNTQMEKYRATRDFGMGGMSIQRGMAIEFDGYNIRVAGRPPLVMPTFKGAVTAKWAVPEAEYDSGAPLARPQSAGIKVRPADMGNPANRGASSMIATAQAEENIVSDVEVHAAGVRKTNQARGNRVAHGVEPQDGVTVRTLQTQANSRNGARTTLTGSNTHQALQQASQVQIEAGRGITREELMARMSPEQREQYKAEIESRKAAHLPLDQRVAVQQGPDHQGQVLATLAAPEDVDTMGFHITTSVGGGTETVDLSGLDGAPAELKVVESEGMRFRQTNGPRKGEAVKQQTAPPVSFEDMDPRRVIARAICRDFPDQYDFEAPARKKIARLRADFEDRPDVIRAVAAAETDSDVKGLLVGEFPEAFQSVSP